ncbi:DegT/DnrJ/EryC1/StrS aminotransferase family protein [Sphingomonas sp. J315]|uniref:DegT/DnrJ/EryC1/StrS family aminotransferase n=1 Tax=Sphingomonas sp. J315 TaxID=2898433 RepID=UPI0021AE3214|nr:DegT/DnrJ/EryC1/StrS family aminotransferase [Sphingomonas sp. J315]UUY00566.1 DegT/DnrJ/EryC1/StrS family aminotransferase [Sphingomonas sp. J315]
MVKFLDLTAQYESIKGDIDAAIARTIERTSFIGGPDLKPFEDPFAEFQQAAHCIAVGNGTDAIEIALEALDLPPGSEILVPANSFIASSEAVTRSGHRVVFCEPDPETMLIDVADAAKRITPKTKAIMCVHLYGQPCDMDGINSLADAHGLKIIEDSAQAHGAEHRGRRVGAIGDVGTFSFYPGKNLGAYGDGGAIVTSDADLAMKCRMIANHGRIDKYDHKFEGRNSRLDGMQAAILRAKLPHLDGWVDRRNAVAAAYHAGLAGIEGLTLPTVSANVRHAYHLFVVRTDRRDALAAHLKTEGIESGIHYPIALNDLEAYAYLRSADAPVRASAIAPTLLSLPMGEHLEEAEVERVIASVRAFFAG